MTIDEIIRETVKAEVARQLAELERPPVEEPVTPAQLRAKARFSIAQLAEIAGVSEVTVGRIEAGKVAARWTTISNLAMALSIEPCTYSKAVDVVRRAS